MQKKDKAKALLHHGHIPSTNEGFGGVGTVTTWSIFFHRLVLNGPPVATAIFHPKKKEQVTLLLTLSVWKINFPLYWFLRKKSAKVKCRHLQEAGTSTSSATNWYTCSLCRSSKPVNACSIELQLLLNRNEALKIDSCQELSRNGGNHLFPTVDSVGKTVLADWFAGSMVCACGCSAQCNNVDFFYMKQEGCLGVPFGFGWGIELVQFITVLCIEF